MAGSGAAAVTVADLPDHKAPLLENEAGRPKEEVDETLPAARRGPNLLAIIPVSILSLGAVFCLAGGLTTLVSGA